MRGANIGFHTVRFVVTYKSQEKLRYYRLQATLEVKPSLKISTRYDLSLKEIDEAILQLAIRPALEARLTIKQISSLSSHNLRILKDIASEVYFITVKNGPQNQILFDQD
jgi:hypothetical protein